MSAEIPAGFHCQCGCTDRRDRFGNLDPCPLALDAIECIQEGDLAWPPETASADWERELPDDVYDELVPRGFE